MVVEVVDVVVVGKVVVVEVVGFNVVVVVVGLISILHLKSQPSPFLLFPSSHCSPRDF